jgi:hypothetical protein
MCQIDSTQRDKFKYLKILKSHLLVQEIHSLLWFIRKDLRLKFRSCYARTKWVPLDRYRRIALKWLTQPDRLNPSGVIKLTFKWKNRKCGRISWKYECSSKFLISSHWVLSKWHVIDFYNTPDHTRHMKHFLAIFSHNSSGVPLIEFSPLTLWQYSSRSIQRYAYC